MIKDIGKYVDRYQRMKNWIEALVRKLIVNKVSEKSLIEIKCYKLKILE